MAEILIQIAIEVFSHLLLAILEMATHIALESKQVASASEHIANQAAVIEPALRQAAAAIEPAFQHAVNLLIVTPPPPIDISHVLHRWAWRRHTGEVVENPGLIRALHTTFREHLEKYAFIGPRRTRAFFSSVLASRPFQLNPQFVPIGTWFEYRDAPTGPIVLARLDPEDPQVYRADIFRATPTAPEPWRPSLESYLDTCWQAEESEVIRSDGDVLELKFLGRDDCD